MKNIGLQGALIAFGLSAFLAGCGGGSDVSPAKPVALSADQAASEQFLLAPNASYNFQWDLPSSGNPVNGLNFLIEEHASMAASPLTAGAQKLIETSPTSIANSLSVPTGIPARYLVNGAILVGSTSQSYISYQGTGVRTDGLAADNVTAVASSLRSNYSVVPLTGAVTAAPSEFAQFFNALYSNPALLSASATWSPGSAYEKYTGTQIGDLYTVGDYTGVTTGSAPTPVASGTTIAALMAAGGIASATDLTTYTLGNGSVSVINGVTTYVSSNVRPNLTTPTYRTYYQLNGNVYVGSLVKSGTVQGGNVYAQAIPGTAGFTLNYSQNYQIRLNAAAVASLRAAVTF
jgi:hypothetical protein